MGQRLYTPEKLLIEDLRAAGDLMLCSVSPVLGLTMGEE
jgi:hypothetical protein